MTQSTDQSKGSTTTRSGGSKLTQTDGGESQESSSEDEASYSHLETADRETAESRAANTWASDQFKESMMTAGQLEWMKKLKKGDLSGVMPKLSQFLRLTGNNSLRILELHRNTPISVLRKLNSDRTSLRSGTATLNRQRIRHYSLGRYSVEPDVYGSKDRNALMCAHSSTD